MKSIAKCKKTAATLGIVAAMASFVHAQDPFEVTPLEEENDVIEFEEPEVAEFEESETIDIVTGSMHEEFEKALAELEEKELESAAERLSKAALMVEYATDEAEGKVKAALAQESKVLASLSTEISGGKITDAKTLKQAFAKTHHILANHYATAAKTAEELEQGAYLLGAVHHAEQAAAMAEYKIAGTDLASLKAAKIMGEGLADGEEIGKAKTAAGIKALAKACEAIGGHLKASGNRTRRS